MMQTSKPKRILIVRLSALGDVVNTLPALTALRRGHPKAHIAWLVEDRAADILQNHPLLDEVIVFPRSKWQQSFSLRRGRWRTLADCYQLFSALRARRFDIAIDFQGNAKSGFLTYMSVAKVRVGFDRRNSVEGNLVFTNRRVAIEDPHINRAEKYLALARAAGGATGPVRAVLPTWPDEAATAKALLREAGAMRRPLIAIHPGTSEFGAFKRWPPERFGQLARRLARRWNAGILVTWGPRERPLAVKVASAAGRSAAISPPTRSIRELAELLRQADLFISADTGPMHIAAALGVPVVALFGPKDPVLYGPYGEKTSVVRAGVDCSPCAKRSCDDVKCMRSITPEMVMAAVEELLVSGSGFRVSGEGSETRNQKPETRNPGGTPRKPHRRDEKWHAAASSSSRPRPAKRAKRSPAPSSRKSSRRA